MKYFKNNNNEIFALEGKDTLPVFETDKDGNEIQIKPSYVKDDWIEISKEEVDATNKAKEDEYKATAEYKLSEAKTYLAATDFKMTSDYDQDVTEVKVKRQEAREFIRANEGDNV
jgi:hypothetical protein